MPEEFYATATGWLFETGIQPALYALGLMDWARTSTPGWTSRCSAC